MDHPEESWAAPSGTEALKENAAVPPREMRNKLKYEGED
jgi:hypothetical protein